MSLHPVIDRQRFLALGYTRQTWDRMVRQLPQIRPNGEGGRKVFLAEADVQAYLAEHTITPRRRRAHA